MFESSARTCPQQLQSNNLARNLSSKSDSAILELVVEARYSRSSAAGMADIPMMQQDQMTKEELRIVNLVWPFTTHHFRVFL